MGVVDDLIWCYSGLLQALHSGITTGGGLENLSGPFQHAREALWPTVLPLWSQTYFSVVLLNRYHFTN